MTLRSQPPSWDLLRPELEEMRFLLTRSNFDDREWEPLPSWQCMHASSFGQLTTLGRPMGVSVSGRFHIWKLISGKIKFLRRFLRAYLEAFYTDDEMAAPLEDVEVFKAANGTPINDPTPPDNNDANGASDNDEVCQRHGTIASAWLMLFYVPVSVQRRGRGFLELDIRVDRRDSWIPAMSGARRG